MGVEKFIIERRAYFAGGFLEKYDGEKVRLEAWVEERVLGREIDENDLLSSMNTIEFKFTKFGDLYIEILTAKPYNSNTSGNVFFIIHPGDRLLGTIITLLISQGKDTSLEKDIVITKKDNVALFEVFMKLFFKNFR